MAIIIEVKPQSELLAKVQELWRPHSDTLGFLPEGAFDEHAQKRCLLATVAPDGNLSGYVLFRVARHRNASIAHLCVAPAHRGKGLAPALFEAVKSRVSRCDDITVRCRRDFDASRLWPRLGFVAIGEERGKGKEDTVLTIWRYELNQPPLLAAMSRRAHEEKMPVIIDANIFFDLDDGAVEHIESKALQSDWLGAFIELCLTEEIYNEINRRGDPSHRQRQRARAAKFRILPSNKTREEQAITDLQQRFPNWKSDSARSDMRQLARTIASGATYFVTRDTLVREQADELYEHHGIVIVSPFELVLRFDELRREEEYRPRRFVSIGIKKVKPRGDDLEQLADLVHTGQPAPEPRKRTLSRLRDILAAPTRFEVACITASDNTLIAAQAIERLEDKLHLPLFAVADSALGRTAAQHFAEKVVALAAREHRSLIEIDAAAGGQRVEEALLDAGFSKERDHWIKIAVPLVATAGKIATELPQIGLRHPQAQPLALRLANYLHASTIGAEMDTGTASQAEHALWPAKITGTALPCFIVPIQARWAKDLFDVSLAERTLFGADPQLAMNAENAYYRAPRPAVLTAPGRILWYVSQDPRYGGTMAVRACSRLEEVVVTKPKEAFRQFRRLGVYTWRDVFEIADNNLESDVMAFRFSRTELFSKPISWDHLQETLRRHGGKGSQIQSPTRISEACFMDLYQLAMSGA